ncbi:MAG: hypothetical protein R3C03_24135 [Pirellulaceae bacterium]
MAEFIRFNKSVNNVNKEFIINVAHLASAEIDRERTTVQLVIISPYGERGVRVFNLNGPDAASVISQLESKSE